MNNKNLLLIRTMLLSTSQRNIYLHTDDKRRKRRIIGGWIGIACLYLMLIIYSFATCAGFGASGMAEVIPTSCALIISLLAFVFTFMKSNGYLFNFREYDSLMSLPFGPETIAACKFVYMYLKSLPWFLCISLSGLIGYGIFGRPGIKAYPVWFVLTFFLPVIPMLAASFLGFLIARVSVGFKKGNMLRTVLTFIFIIFCFSSRYIIEAIFRNDRLEQTIDYAAKVMSDAAGIYLPAGWFAGAVVKSLISDALLLVGISILIFGIVFKVVGRSYKPINSGMRSQAPARKNRAGITRKRSVVGAIAFKEYRRLTGSTLYMTNAAIGEVIAVLLGIVALVFGFDRIIATVTNGAPIDSAMVRPAIPFIVYFLIGMMATTACSPSLEGKNAWILQSLPVDKKTVYQGKMLFNMYLSVPFMAFTTICFCISAKVPALETILYLGLGFMLCAFSTAWGCVCGVKHIKLNWDNEVEVIKQGSAVPLYMLPNMFVVMGLIVLMVFLGLHLDHRLLACIMIVIAGGLAALSYARVMSLSKN